MEIKQYINKADFLNEDTQMLWNKLKKLTNDEIDDLFKSLDQNECWFFAENLTEEQLAIILNRMNYDVYNNFCQNLDKELRNNQQEEKESEKDKNPILPSEAGPAATINSTNIKISKKPKKAVHSIYNLKKIVFRIGTLAAISGSMYLIYKLISQSKTNKPTSSKTSN